MRDVTLTKRAQTRRTWRQRLAERITAPHGLPWGPGRHSHAPPTEPDSDTGATAAVPAPPAAAAVGGGGTALWRMRTTVRDRPGSLAALCAALAVRQVDILSLQTHPLADGTVDEMLLRAPAELPAEVLSAAAATGGGRDTWVERADAHDLVDAPTRVLGLATRTALDAAELPVALRQLLGRCTIRSQPAEPAPAQRDAAGAVPAEGLLEEPVMRLRDPAGGWVTVERPHLPFTPTEFARARALIELDSQLGPRAAAADQGALTLPAGDGIVVRGADASDLEAARALHARCSRATLALRYHGPVHEADRYLEHLLSPRYGRTLAVQTTSGQLVALGHLLWDGEEAEVALLVEDAWQRRGIGTRLLRHLVELAAETEAADVYAVTQATNTGMVAAMRGLGLPLDYQVEEGTLVITAQLTAAALPARPRSEGC
ncbi:GNAT family N-acetyltransferase [Streptomyces sp. HSW2009]|uniref:GNAT family N-acetyltransferase n=1 Tax=Streptomyces sp. HSW2009 TaxID=3142890 RepID=UPI0032EDDD0A